MSDFEKPVYLNSIYYLLGLCGEGGFAQTSKALNRRSLKYVAIKRLKFIPDIGEHPLPELHILRVLKASQNSDKKYIVTIDDFFTHEGIPHMVFEYLPFSLDNLLDDRVPTDLEVRAISYSIFKALIFLSTGNPGFKVVHGDLKPDNIMFDSQGRLKIIDFGLSFNENQKLYPYVQNRFYRAPEVFLYLTYGCEIDMWSAGCTIFECVAKKRLFEGESDLDQLMLISEVLGMPHPQLIDASPTKEKYFELQSDGSYEFQLNEEIITGPSSKNLYGIIDRESFDYFDHSIIDLISKMIVYDQKERLCPTEAILHPLFENCEMMEEAIRLY